MRLTKASRFFANTTLAMSASKQATRTSILLAELTTRSEQDPALEQLLRREVLPIVEDYVAMNWWGELPDTIDPEEQEVIELLTQLGAAREVEGS